ncbi:MAG TPA: phosphonate C-P lyase system protein PhnG [Spirochaetia bacterium]|nr:phosphonate C-P lyase system protein PhnG [Spirochaetia bacterium]
MDYSEIVAEASVEAAREMADWVVRLLPVKVLRPPSPGMVMVRHVDPLENTLFLLGEAYVLECEVEVDGLLGYGCTLGSGGVGAQSSPNADDERALCAALVDAVVGGQHRLASELLPLLQAEAARIAARREEEARATASTRVSFEVR